MMYFHNETAKNNLTKIKAWGECSAAASRVENIFSNTCSFMISISAILLSHQVSNLSLSAQTNPSGSLNSQPLTPIPTAVKILAHLQGPIVSLALTPYISNAFILNYAYILSLSVMAIPSVQAVRTRILICVILH